MAAACGCWAGTEGDRDDTHSLGKQRIGVDMPLPLLTAAHSCQAGTEGDNDDAHYFAE